MICVITPFRPDSAPSERFRISAYLGGFWKLNDPVRFSHFYKKHFNPKYFAGHFLGLTIQIFRKIKLAFQLAGFNSILLHREAIPFGPPVFEWLLFKVLRKKVIYDFDDAIWLPDVNGESWLKKFLKCRWKIKYIIKNSYQVIAGNSFLLEYAKKYNPNTIIIPTVVDTEVYKPARNQIKEKQLVIGWTGSASTMKYLNDLYPILDEVCGQYNVFFKIISDEKPVYESERFIFCPWNKDSEVEDLQDIDIGIMPLTDDEWSKGKCGFKAIQFMALEIPVLVSPVGVNKELVTHEKEGYHCHNSLDWHNYLIKLIEAPDLRTLLGKRGRKKIVDNYSLESTKDLFFSLFE